MAKLLLVANQKENFAGLETELKKNEDIKIKWAGSKDEALNMLSDRQIDLVVVDGEVDGISGLEIVEEMVKVNPLANYAVVSLLSAHDYHEKSEGLGVLMQLPEQPDETQAKLLLERLEKVLSLTFVETSNK